MLRSNVCHIFPTGRPTNFKLGIPMKHDDPYHSQEPCQGRKDTWSVWQVLAHKSRTKSPRNTKIGRKVAQVFNDTRGTLSDKVPPFLHPSFLPFLSIQRCSQSFCLKGSSFPSLLPLLSHPFLSYPFPSFLSLPSFPLPSFPIPFPPLNPTRGYGGALWAPPAGSVAEPRPPTHFGDIWVYRNVSGNNGFWYTECTTCWICAKNFQATISGVWSA